MLGDRQQDSAMPGGLHPTCRQGDPPSAKVSTASFCKGVVGGKAALMAPDAGQGAPASPSRGQAGGRSCPPPPPPRRSDDELGDFVVGEIQREVFAGSFDGEGLLDVDALLGQAAVAVEPFLLQPVGAAKGVALGRILAEVGQLQEVLLVEPNVIQAQAVPVRRRLRFPARRLGKAERGLRTRQGAKGVGETQPPLCQQGFGVLQSPTSATYLG